MSDSVNRHQRTFTPEFLKPEIMEKILELIEQVRFAELKKIDRYTLSEETFLKEDTPADKL